MGKLIGSLFGLMSVGGCLLYTGLVIGFWGLVFLALAKFVFGWSPF